MFTGYTFPEFILLRHLYFQKLVIEDGNVSKELCGKWNEAKRCETSTRGSSITITWQLLKASFIIKVMAAAHFLRVNYFSRRGINVEKFVFRWLDPSMDLNRVWTWTECGLEGSVDLNKAWTWARLRLEQRMDSNKVWTWTNCGLQQSVDLNWAWTWTKRRLEQSVQIFPRYRRLRAERNGPPPCEFQGFSIKFVPNSQQFFVSISYQFSGYWCVLCTLPTLVHYFDAGYASSMI